MKIIGIDPGISATGFGIIEDKSVVCTGTIRPKNNEIYEKILEICEHIEGVIEENHIAIAVLEKVFYQKNIYSLMRASELRGAIILTLLKNNIKIYEYTPAQIKLTTTGNGRASKKQVQYFIERLLLKTKKNISNHAIDALSIAYTANRKIGRISECPVIRGKSIG